MRVLITGGAGFIGSHIVDECIARGDEPFVLDDLSSGSPDNLPSGVRLFQVDVCDAPAVAKVFAEVKPDVVSHQAAQMSVSRSVREPSFDAQVNILGLINVFEQAAQVGTKRIVFASSGGVLYGDVTEPADEHHPAKPISPYGISKWAGEQYLEFYCREKGLTGVALRYSNVYGPRQNPHGEAGVVAIFCQKMLAGTAPTINGDGKYDRDYVFGPDVARANWLAATAPLPTPFVALNIGTGVKADVNELEAKLRPEIERHRERMERAEPLPAAHHGPARAGDLRSSVIDATRAKELLGWEPQVVFADGLRLTADWFAQHVKH